MDGTKWTMKKILNDYKCEGQISIFDFIPEPEGDHNLIPAEEYFMETGKKTYWQDSQGKKAYWWRDKDFMNPPEEAAKAAAPICKHSKHTCNKKELWKVADTLDEIQCPHVCCRMCNTRNCGARCNGSEEPKRTPQIYRYLRYGPHTLVAEVREEAKAWLDQNGVPEWVKWSKSSLPCENCTWWDGTNCCSGGHTNHYEYGYLICDGFYQSCVERKPSTVGEGFPQVIKQESHIYPLDIKGICDDPYCPQCGYAFETIKTCKNYEVDCERCPECHVKVDWTLWHRINDKEVT